MRSLLLVCLASLALFGTAAAENWAVIIAGSSTFQNYRHQADACHAYQIVKKNGIPEDRIILFLHDDIANANQNPFPGQVFNAPSDNATDVYDGCRPDYTGKDVNKENFLAALTGDSATTGGKKVLKSTSGDKVFINFADHGGVGIVCMPDGKNLYAKELMATLNTMHQKKMYSKLVFYMEACESGSMFKTLPTDMNIFATTAANAKESSWGTYCPPHDKVNGKHIGSCLGDLYSVNWMEDSDKAVEQQSETLSSQYALVKKETNKSHVSEFGTVQMASDKIHEYQGEASYMASKVLPLAAPVKPDPEHEKLKLASAVESRDIPLVTKFYAYLRASPLAREAQAKELVAEIGHREEADARFAKIVAAVSGDSTGKLLTAHLPLTDHECQMEAMESVMAACGTFSDYSLKYTRSVVNLCESGHSAKAIAAAARAVC